MRRSENTKPLTDKSKALLLVPLSGYAISPKGRELQCFFSLPLGEMPNGQRGFVIFDSITYHFVLPCLNRYRTDFL